MNKEPNKDLMDILKAADTVEETYTPEQSLLSEIIKRAVWDAFGRFGERKAYEIRRSKKTALEAQAWLWSKSEEPFSCRWICEHTAMDYDSFIANLEIHLVTGKMVEQLRDPLGMIDVVRYRLWKRKRGLDAQTTIINVDYDLTDRGWRELLQDSSPRGKRDTWPDD